MTAGNEDGIKMAQKSSAPVNLDDTPEMEVFSLNDIARKIDLPSYSAGRQLLEWHDDSTIETPRPAIKIGANLFWTADESVLARWRELYLIDLWLKAEKEHTAVEAVVFQALPVLERIMQRAKSVLRLNQSAYKNNRGNSLQDARRRCIEIEAEWDFVSGLFSTSGFRVPETFRGDISKVISEARTHANLK